MNADMRDWRSNNRLQRTVRCNRLFEAQIAIGSHTIVE